MLGGVPHLRSGYLRWGTPWPGMGYPPDLGWGTSPQTWDGVPPGPRIGYPPTWDGVPPDLRWGTPLQTWDGVPPPQVWTDTQTRVKTLPSLILRTRAVKMAEIEVLSNIGVLPTYHKVTCKMRSIIISNCCQWSLSTKNGKTNHVNWS